MGTKKGGTNIQDNKGGTNIQNNINNAWSAIMQLQNFIPASGLFTIVICLLMQHQKNQQLKNGKP